MREIGSSPRGFLAINVKPSCLEGVEWVCGKCRPLSTGQGIQRLRGLSDAESQFNTYLSDKARELAAQMRRWGLDYSTDLGYTRRVKHKRYRYFPLSTWLFPVFGLKLTSRSPHISPKSQQMVRSLGKVHNCLPRDGGMF